MSEEITCGRFMAWDEGCIECGEPSGVVGIYGTKAEAEKAAEQAKEDQAKDWQGQHYCFVVDLKTLQPKSKYRPRQKSKS